jgi:hypothetical protein
MTLGNFLKISGFIWSIVKCLIAGRLMSLEYILPLI